MARSNGPIRFDSTMGDKGIPPTGGKPKSSEGKKGTIQFSGNAGDKGVPPKKCGGGKMSGWAAKHD